MKQITVLLAMTAALSALAGCKEAKAPEVVQTVDWYKAHQTERTAVLEKCKNNPGELAATPNCVNAHTAANQLVWSSRGSGITIKAKTAEELRNANK
ncbi:hypothetical protein J2X54_001956 [Duganella sp. 3397]|uniref:EexN family lipoprotein n=1 Tax=Duganella sp. 3397 TaxID=2817732 RepID=UPI002862DBA7|nr:EexN family lipoprotein [Duganella sp. 3397]MDR7049501.1 hypothetical protein [Duganella sp. 3397]